jgi:hypothetical protein
MAILALGLIAMTASLPALPGQGAKSPYFKIRVVDSVTGRGVPLVELKTVNHLRYLTDSNGLVAFNEPGLMGKEVYFHIRSHGYEIKADGFGYRGTALKPVAGGAATVKIERLNIAERLCRLTGQGIYRDSLLLGEKTPLKDPVLNGGVMGQDTAQAEIYRGKMIWFWGDTDRTGFPLGNFFTTGGWATLPKGGADEGIEFAYFTKPDGFVKPMIASTESMPIWVSGMAVLGSGKDESLYAYYAQMRKLGEIATHGYLKWNDAAERFDIVQTFAKDRDWRFMDGHLVKHEGDLWGNCPPNVRVAASWESMQKPETYRAFTPLDADGKVRRVDGKPDYRWQKELPPLGSRAEQRLVEKGDLKAEEAYFLPKDEKGATIVPHGGSVHWNDYRKRWIMIFTRIGGKDSDLGEIYYSEATAPNGPFHRATKILTHDKYTFYNPVHHPFLDRDGGRTIYLEGTYTAEFSGNEDKTPLYNYNQVLYKLDLGDSRMAYARG